MVAGHESCGRLAVLDAEHAELRTRAAVLEEQAAPPAPTRSASGRRCESARAGGAASLREQEALRAQAARLAEEGEAATRAAVEALARGGGGAGAGEATARRTGRLCGASWLARMWARRKAAAEREP
jgi:hypothetical protein